MRIFCYGSNLLLERLRARTPSARPIAVATLGKHRLAFEKLGQDGSAKCNVSAMSATEEDVVHGAVVEIDALDLGALHTAESVGQGYDFADVTVQGDGEAMACKTYVARPEAIARDLRPFDWYRDFVLYGALQHGLPAAYVAQIRAVEAVVDPDPIRRQRNLQLIPRALQLQRSRLTP